MVTEDDDTDDDDDDDDHDDNGDGDGDGDVDDDDCRDDSYAEHDGYEVDDVGGFGDYGHKVING